MENKSLRENFSQKGRDRVERLFDTNKIADEFSNVLKEVFPIIP